MQHGDVRSIEEWGPRAFFADCKCRSRRTFSAHNHTGESPFGEDATRNKNANRGLLAVLLGAKKPLEDIRSFFFFPTGSCACTDLTTQGADGRRQQKSCASKELG